MGLGADFLLGILAEKSRSLVIIRESQASQDLVIIALAVSVQEVFREGPMNTVLSLLLAWAR
eukprot:16220009-Heterocapsa_arctica.AAC.1